MLKVLPAGAIESTASIRSAFDAMPAARFLVPHWRCAPIVVVIGISRYTTYYYIYQVLLCLILPCSILQDHSQSHFRMLIATPSTLIIFNFNLNMLILPCLILPCSLLECSISITAKSCYIYPTLLYPPSSGSGAHC